MTFTASTKERGCEETDDLECCCSVLMVSNGAKIILEEAAARELARLFLRPANHAASEDFTGTGRLATFSFRILLVAASFGLLDGITETVFPLMGAVAMKITNRTANVWEILPTISETLGCGYKFDVDAVLQLDLRLLWLENGDSPFG